MDNEKLNNEEEIETVEETTEVTEVVEEAVEVVDEIEAVETDNDETVDEGIDELETEEALADAEIAEYLDEIGEIDGAKKGNGGKIAAIAGGAVAVVVAIVAVLWYFGIINPYERGYIDISGVTLEELADQQGYSLKEYKKANGLPLLMPKSTNENAVRNNANLGATIEQSGMSFDEFKEYYGWGDNVTEKSTVGEALGETRLAVIIGAAEADDEAAKEVLASFKEYYGFGDEVTLDTLYKDVREQLDKKALEQRLEEEKNAAEESEEEDDSADEADAESNTDAETDTEEAAE